jgi:WD40 repeat protein
MHIEEIPAPPCSMTPLLLLAARLLTWLPCSPLASQSVSHRTGIPINALDISPDRTHVILAGRDILKTVRVDDTKCAEDFNLRAHITAYASTHNASRDAVSAQHRDQLTANDVKWSNKLFDTCIATAATSGRIVIYDVNRPSLEVARFHEHTRQVHKLAFSPYQGALLLSGSQDGTVRMWDLRVPTSESNVRTVSIKRFFGNSDGVRDVRWSPTDGVEFAIGTDSGAVQKWDFRKENAPMLKINAHDKACHSVDWHPSGKYLASAGADKQVKVWDFRSSDRRMKPCWALRTPQAILNARWRPCDTSMKNGLPESQLATSYVGKDPRIHVWDFHRPHMPCQEFDRHESVASDFLWHSEARLWSVGSAGMFMQTDMSSVSRPIDRQNVNIITAGPDARFCFFSDKRYRQRISHGGDEDDIFQYPISTRTSGEKMSGTPSANEGSLEEPSTLNSSLQIRRQKSGGSRMANTPFVTPVRGAESFSEEGMNLEPTFASTQSAASGYVHGVFDAAAYAHLARAYRLPKFSELLADTKLPDSLRTVFGHNADVAAQVGLYRLAQTWRILGLAVQRSLEARASHARSSILRPSGLSRPTSIAVESPPIFDKVHFGPPSDTKPTTSGHFQHGFGHVESSSNIATPLARPAPDASIVPIEDETILSNGRGSQLSHPTSEQLVVRPAGKSSPDASDISPGELVPWTSLSPKTQSLAIKDSHDMPVGMPFDNSKPTDAELENRRLALNAYRGQPRALLRLDDLKEGSYSPAIPMRVERHDSNESFQMFSASLESDPRSVPIIGSFGDSRRSDTSDPVATSLSTSIRQELASSILAQNLSSKPEQRRPSMLPPPPHPPPAPAPPRPPIERKESAVTDGTSTNAYVHGSVVRPPEYFFHVKTNFRSSSSTKERPAVTFDRSSNPYLADNNEDSLHPSVDLPWSLYAVLPPLMDYHLDTVSDVQFPSVIATYLYPLFPSLFPIPERTAAHLRSYHSQLMSMRLHLEASAFREACAAQWPDLARSLTMDPGSGVFWCDDCSKPVKGDKKGWCDRCSSAWGPCGVCESVVPPSVDDLYAEQRLFQDGEAEDEDCTRMEQGTSLWAWCQGCGHGGHDQCLRVWFALSESSGVCHVPYCGHDCMPGSERDRRRKEAEGEANRSTSSVVRDGWKAHESRAVEGARRLVGKSSRGKTSEGVGGRWLRAGSGAGAAGVALIEDGVD